MLNPLFSLVVWKIIANFALVMKQKQYRADYEAIIDGEKHYPDSDYFSAANDKEAIEWAKYLASEGIDYADVGHVDTELTYVAECDDDWNEIGLIYY